MRALAVLLTILLPGLGRGVSLADRPAACRASCAKEVRAGAKSAREKATAARGACGHDRDCVRRAKAQGRADAQTCVSFRRNCRTCCADTAETAACTARCGNGRIESGEECDDPTSACCVECRNVCGGGGAQCGDGKVDPGEECDGDTCCAPAGCVRVPCKRYLMAFLACDPSAGSCGDPHNHVFLPNQVRRYSFTTGAWGNVSAVSLSDPSATTGFVDPSPVLDASGRITLFYLPGIAGQDPASCPIGQASCTKTIRSATEVDGTDGGSFVADPGDRASATVGASAPGGPTFSDPDVFFDGTTYHLYVSRGQSVQAFTSESLKGTYTPITEAPNGIFVSGLGGVPSGFFDAGTGAYWTYVTRSSMNDIARAVHTSFAPLASGDFTAVLTGAAVGLPGWVVQSSGIAPNTP